MTQIQKEQNKNFILNNPDKFIIDSRGDFVNLEKDFKDSDYIIWKNAVEDYEEVKEKIIKEIFRDKEKWKLFTTTIDKEKKLVDIHKKIDISEDLAEEILLEKDKWEIVYETSLFGMVNIRPIFYKHLPTGKEVDIKVFTWSEQYILSGELGWRKGMCWDYEKNGRRELAMWKGDRARKKSERERRKKEKKATKNTSQPAEQTQNQNSTSEQNANPETEPKEQESQNSKPTSSPESEPVNNENLPPKKDGEKNNQPEEQAKQQKLRQQRDKSITKITIALNQEPKVTNNELSPQYQNWEEQINQLADIQKITNLQNRILADIQACQKDKKSAQETKENLNKAKTGTKEEKEKAWQNLEKQETEKGYNGNKTEIENLKKEQATENPQKYGEEAQKRIKEKLKSNQVKEKELTSENQKEWQKLKKGEIKDPGQLVDAETKIKENIYQKEAEKKVIDFTARVNKALELKEKEQITALKKELLEFISSSNIYYSKYREKAEKLLTQLENYSIINKDQTTTNVHNKNQNLPWKVIIPFLLLVLLLIVLIPLIILLKPKRKIEKKKK